MIFVFFNPKMFKKSLTSCFRENQKMDDCVLKAGIVGRETNLLKKRTAVQLGPGGSRQVQSGQAAPVPVLHGGISLGKPGLALKVQIPPAALHHIRMVCFRRVYQRLQRAGQQHVVSVHKQDVFAGGPQQTGVAGPCRAAVVRQGKKFVVFPAIDA